MTRASWLAGTIFSMLAVGWARISAAATATAPSTSAPAAPPTTSPCRANHERVTTAGGAEAPGVNSGCGGVRSPSWFIAEMPHSINSGDQINLLAARARCQGVSELQLGQGQHLVGRKPGRSATRILPLNLAVNGHHPRVVLLDLGGALAAQRRVDPVRHPGHPGPIRDGDHERPGCAA